MRQCGKASRLTAAEIAEVREVWRALETARARRREIEQRHRMSKGDFWLYGTGVAGKKPRRAA